MRTRTVEWIMSPPAPHYVGDGFRVHNFIPGTRLDMQRMSPFIFLDYNSKFHFPPSERPRGVGVHPHRGFETVTIAYKGRIAHHDSSGNSGVIGEGEVQWMTAASGVLHKEYHETEFSAQGGDFHMVQLWVNLPARFKMSPPKYQAITRDMVARYVLPDSAGEVRIIAGEYQGVRGPASTFTPMHLYNAHLRAGAQAEFVFPADYNTALLVVEGHVHINGVTSAPVDNFVLFQNDGEAFRLEAQEDALVLILSGEPIREPVAAQGPFVMNTRAEIIQAFEDFHSGKFGYLEK